MSTFSEHLKFLVEGKLNEATKEEIDKEKSFEPNVILLLKKSGYVFDSNRLGEYAELKLGSIKRIGEFKIKVNPWAKGDVAVDIGLDAVDETQGRVSLVEATIKELTQEKLDTIKKHGQDMFSNLKNVLSIK
jgi:hypothetical protein